MRDIDDPGFSGSVSDFECAPIRQKNFQGLLALPDKRLTDDDFELIFHAGLYSFDAMNARIAMMSLSDWLFPLPTPCSMQRAGAQVTGQHRRELSCGQLLVAT